MDLGLDRADLDTCVQCGLCLPHCPTYRVTGDETMSPRGRIALMRAVQFDGAPPTKQVVDSFDTCVQCRGCEPACPSSVPYGRLIEGTKEALAKQPPTLRRRRRHWIERTMLWTLGRPRLLRAISTLAAVAARIGVVPRRFSIARRLPLRRRRHRVSGGDVYLFTGCVMDAWQREVHHATSRVLEAAGFGVTPTGDRVPCCGALHHHAGATTGFKAHAARTITELGHDTRPILVNSAGCGATMKDYGRLLGTDASEAFSARVFDVHEWLADRMDLFAKVEPLDVRVAVQDPCHLRHVQRAHEATRMVLAPFVREIVELNDDGLCCGAGGAYSVLQPALAGDIRARKIQNVTDVAPDVVASANPGCSMHLAAGGVNSEHPMMLIFQALNQGNS